MHIRRTTPNERVSLNSRVSVRLPTRTLPIRISTQCPYRPLRFRRTATSTPTRAGDTLVVRDQIILRFLSAGLINVGGDDTKLEKLQEAAADLATALKKTPSKAVPFALIAFDPEAPADDPVMEEAIEALKKRWATYVNTFSGTPVAVLRAVLLDALVQAAGEDEKVGVAFVTSARNALPLMEAGNEGAIWADVVTDIEQRVDARAEAEWATPEMISVPSLTFDGPTPVEVSRVPVSINEAALTKKFEAAAGPNNAAGQPTGGNPYWPHNQPQNWLGEFASRLANAVTEALGEVADGAEIKPIDFSVPLKDLTQAVSGHIDQTLKAISGATAGLQRRTNLIWWKETLYSPSACASYRTMPASVAAGLMALDFHRQVPTLSPASVAAFLHETVLSLPSIDPDEVRPIRDLAMEAAGSHELAPLRQTALDLVGEPVGRGPLLGLIGKGADAPPLSDRTFRDLFGVSATTGVTVPQWATWVFRELQAARATQEGGETKRRGRKTR